MSEPYEFDAPSYVVDLKELANTEVDDQWFEQQAVGEHALLATPMGRSNVPEIPTAVVPPIVDVDAGEGTSISPPPNIVTSWGPGKETAGSSRRTVNQAPAQPRRVPKRKSELGSSAQPKSAAPPSKKHKKSPEEDAAATSKSGNKSVAAAHAGQLSSEERELERMKNLQKEVALQRKKNEASYRAALAGGTHVKAGASSSASRMVLRGRSSLAKANRGATVPKPFNLSMGKKRTAASGAYVSMAQQIAQFQNRTPDRYHLRSRKSQERGPAAMKGEHLKLTMPHSPNLMTRQRSRPPVVKSSAELEAEEVANLQKFKFKAQELNKKILEHPEDLNKPAAKEPTVPEGFELQVEKRLQERQTTKKPQEDQEKPHTFKPQPLPKKILEGVVGVPEKKVLQITVPESPAFALKNRVRVERKAEEEKPPSPVKVRPVPHFGLPFLPRHPESHNVEVCPFSFEERERERRALKEKRLEEQNEEVPQFKAQPLPDFSTVVLPEKKKQGPTKPEPFRLLIDERGTAKSSRLEQKMKEEEKQREEAVTFKANPNTVTHKEPFQPKMESRIATAIEPFELSTERRARERQEYERLASEKEALRALMEEQKRREEEQREKEEIARLRQEQTLKAQPIRHYKPVTVKKSEVPLTVPQSPNFSDRFRL